MGNGSDRGLPNLTVSQLEYLVAVTRHDTWSEAAASVGVTPSALSQGLAELERRIGVPLFGRHGRRRTLTSDATEVVAHAERVLAQTLDLSRWAEGRRAGRTGDLRVGMIDAAAVHRFPGVLSEFRADRPDVDLRLSVAPSGSLLEDLARGHLDLVVCVAPPSHINGLVLSPLVTEELAVYGPPDSRAEVWGPWVTFPAGSHSRARIAAALAARSQSFEIVAESHQPEVLREMVRLGLGWTVLPPVQAEVGSNPLRPAAGGPLTTRTLVLVERVGAVADPVRAELAARLRAAISR